MSPSTGTGCWGFVNVTPAGTGERRLIDQRLASESFHQLSDDDDTDISKSTSRHCSGLALMY